MTSNWVFMRHEGVKEKRRRKGRKRKESERRSKKGQCREKKERKEKREETCGGE